MEVVLIVVIFVGASIFFHLRTSERNRRRPRSSASDSAGDSGVTDWPCDIHTSPSHDGSHGDVLSHADGSFDSGDCGGGDGGGD